MADQRRVRNVGSAWPVKGSASPFTGSHRASSPEGGEDAALNQLYPPVRKQVR